MYVGIYVCVYLCMYVLVYVCIYVYMYVCMYVYVVLVQEFKPNCNTIQHTRIQIVI